MLKFHKIPKIQKQQKVLKNRKEEEQLLYTKNNTIKKNDRRFRNIWI